MTNDEFHQRYRQIMKATYEIRGKKFMWCDYVGSADPCAEKALYWATRRLLEREFNLFGSVQVKDGKIYFDLTEIGKYEFHDNPKYKEQNNEESRTESAGN